MRRLLAALLLLGCGCSGFAAPTPDDFKRLHLAAPRAVTLRCRVHMSVDSEWLAGEFDGVVVVDSGASPVVRAQFFGDLGPKVFDLVARPDRIAGYFPQTREAVDCALPAQAAPHPLLFLGASLLENFADVSEDRVRGIREERRGTRLDLKPVVKGMGSEVVRSPDGTMLDRRLSWMYGLHWDERWLGPDLSEITASGLKIQVRILSCDTLPAAPPRVYDIQLPDDVRIVEGSRK